MAIQYARIRVRASNAPGANGEPPTAVKMLALQLEAAAPEFLFYSDEASRADVNVLLCQAALTKISHVPSPYTFDPSAGEGFRTDHAVDPTGWTPLNDGFGIVYPAVASDATVYYMGFSAP